MAIAIAGLSGCSADSNTEPTTPSETVVVTAPGDSGSRTVDNYIFIAGVDNAGQVAQYSIMSSSGSGTIDIVGLDVSFECATGYRFSGEPSGLRIRLLSTGCARLLDGAGSAEEQAAQAEAQAAALGIWAAAVTSPINAPETGSPVDTAPESTQDSSWIDSVKDWLTAVWEWCRSNWQFVAGSLIGILGLWQFERWYHMRRVRVILAGPASTGKTALWGALENGSAGESNHAPTVGSPAPQSMDPISFGHFTLHPVAVDSAGPDTWHVLDHSTRSRLSSKWKNKRILIVVCAPTRKDDASSQDVLDSEFITMQEGYMGLPRALIGSKSPRIRPDSVILFINKFDLVARHAPRDNDTKAEVALISNRFRTHSDSLKSACEINNVPFALVIGSAKQGWGTDEVLRQFRRVIPKR